MFKRLLSNLPFNPSLIGQVAFYARRVRAESHVRAVGFFIISLAVALQSFAVITPPQATLARSNNDLITGGISTKEQAKSYCTQNIRNYKTILGYYGISCDDLAKTTEVTIKSTDHDKRLYSAGHLAYGKKGETPVDIPKAGTIYFRYLWSWDSAGPSSYKAFKGKTASGQTFYILANCGNLVFIGLPKAPERCQFDQSLPKNDPKCPQPCKYNKSIAANNPQCPKPCPTNGAIGTTDPKCTKPDPCPYDKTITANNPKCSKPCEFNKAISADNPQCPKPCQYNKTISEKDASCKPCTASQSSGDITTCLEYHKQVSNTSQGLSDANGTTVKPGDTLKYTLTTKNTGKIDVKNYVVNENISDVLDYADVLDYNGGTKSSDGVVSWPATTIKARGSITKTLTVRVKNPLPQTPASTSDPGHYDLAMTNVYGNTVTVKLPGSTAKTIEVAVTTLPNTGPGTSLIAAFTVTVVAGYLFARSRLIAKELNIVRAEFGSTGGA